MSAGFASTADLAEKTITFDAIGPDLYAFTAEGDPNSGVSRRRRRRDGARRTGDARDGAGKSIAAFREVTDKPIEVRRC